MSKITYGDLFDFSNDQSIRQAEETIRSLSKSIMDLGKVSQDFKGQAKGLKEGLSSVNTATEKGKQAAIENAEQVKKLGQAYDAFKDKSKAAKESATALDNSLSGLKNRAQALENQARQLKDPLGADKAEFDKLAKSASNMRAELSAAEKKFRSTTGTVKAAKGSYAELVQQNKKLSAEIRNTGNAIGGNNPKLEKMKAQFRQNTEALKKFDGQMGQNFRNVGNYSGGIKSAVAGIGKFVAGITAGILILRQLARVTAALIKTYADFEAQMSEVRAITGATDEEFIKLSDDAIRLGRSTRFTAKQVGELQVAYAKLGFSTQEILNATEATLQLATITGGDLSGAAEVAGATIRGFGLDASESQRVIDVMAKSFTSSALNMEKFKTAMATVAPVAKNAGLGIEQTTAMLSVLVDRGIDASTAGTSLRNIFLETAKSGMTLTEAFELIQNSTNKNATALELFGKRGSTAATILAENVEQANNFTEAYNNAAGSAQKMADVIDDNLKGDVVRFKSAWDGLLLSIEKGDGAIAKFSRGAVTLATKLLNKLAGASEETVSSLEKQARSFDDLRISANAEIEVLKRGNLSQEARRDLITQINSKYGEYLPKLITEKTSIEELTVAQNNLNKALLGEAVARRFKEEIQTSTQATIDATEAYIKQEQQLEKLRIKREKVANTESELNGKTIEQIKREDAEREQSLLTIDNQIESLERNIEINKESAGIFGDTSATMDKYRAIAEEMGIEFDKLIGLTDGLGKSNNALGDDLEDTGNDLTGLIEIQEDVISKLNESVKKATTREEIERLNDELEDAKHNLDILKGSIPDLTKFLQFTGDGESFLKANDILSEEELDKVKKQVDDALGDLNEMRLDAAVDVGNTLLDIRYNNIEAERMANQEQLEQDLKNAGSNEEAKAKLQEQAAKRDLELMQKQAKAEKLQAILNVGVQAALDIFKLKGIAAVQAAGVVTAPLAPITLAQIPLILGTAGATIAAIAARPIPKFATGTKSAPEGPAIVGERGMEMIKSSKGVRLTGNSAELTYLNRGDEVLTHAETMRQIEDNSFFNDNIASLQSSTDNVHRFKESEMNKMAKVMGKEISNNTQRLQEALKNNKRLHFEISKQGVVKLLEKGRGATERLEDYYIGKI